MPYPPPHTLSHLVSQTSCLLSFEAGTWKTKANLVREGLHCFLRVAFLALLALAAFLRHTSLLLLLLRCSHAISFRVKLAELLREFGQLLLHLLKLPVARGAVFPALATLAVNFSVILALIRHEDHFEGVALARVGIDALEQADLVDELLVGVLCALAVHLGEYLTDQRQEKIHEHDCVEKDSGEVEEPLRVRPEGDAFSLKADHRADEGGLEDGHVLT